VIEVRPNSLSQSTQFLSPRVSCDDRGRSV
jgi:hypothetical protein